MPVVHVTPKRYVDAGGWFTETRNEDYFQKQGIKSKFAALQRQVETHCSS